MASWSNCPFALGVDSGTRALELILRALGIGPGDEVITTPFSFVATASAILQVGAEPVFADVDPDSMNLNPEEVKKKITARTGAVLPVHLFGRMADMDGIMNAASGIPVVEDACQAIGAFSTKHSPASTGVAAALSFFPTKNLGGAGDGGMVLTGDPEIAETVRVLRNHGQDQNGFIAQAGCTGRLDALQAAVLSVKLPYLDSWNGRRRENARYYLENLPAAVSFQLPEEGHAYHQFTIRIPDRDRIRAKLAELGIPTAIYYPTPIHLQPLYRGLGYREGDFPVAERLSREVLSLPVCPFLKNEDRERVAAALKSELKETEFIK